MKIARGWAIRQTLAARFSYTFRYIRDHVLHCNALCFTSHMNELMEVGLKQFQITESRLSNREHCKDDCLPSLDGMASLGFQSFCGYTKLTHHTLERLKIKFTGERQTSIRTTWPTFPVDILLYLLTNKYSSMSGLSTRSIFYRF